MRNQFNDRSQRGSRNFESSFGGDRRGGSMDDRSSRTRFHDQNRNQDYSLSDYNDDYSPMGRDRDDDRRSNFGSQDYRRSGYGSDRNYGYSNDSDMLSGNRQGMAIEGSQGYGLYSSQRGLSSSSGDYDRDYGSRSDYGYGERHWGRGEYSDYDDDRSRSRSGQQEEGFFEKIGEKVGEFFGKGPKGYKRSDDRIKEDVSEKLWRASHIDASEVEVDVKEGIVTLNGSVHERRTKRMIEDEIENISGVKDVINNIRVSTSSDLGASGTSLGTSGMGNVSANQNVGTMGSTNVGTNSRSGGRRTQ